MRNRRNHAGAAILAAMLVTATVAAIAAGLFTQINGWLARSDASRASAQAQSLATAGVRWAAQYLNEESRTGPLDHLGELWATGLPPTPVEGGTLAGRIVDAQGKFNLNNLANDAQGISVADIQLAQRLCARLNITEGQLSEAVNRARARSLFTLADAPGFAAHAAVFSVLPQRTPLNVNTAPQMVIEAIVGERAPAVMQARLSQPFQSQMDFTSRTSLTPAVAISGATNFFELEVEAAVDQVRSRSLALAERGKGIRWQVAM